jgi:glutaminyl-peptide cyclotransferase
LFIFSVFKKRSQILQLLAAFVLLTCNSAYLSARASSSSPPAFNGVAALAYTRHAVSFGQRPAGSPALAQLRSWLISQLKPLGGSIGLDSFSAFTPEGSVSMANIVAKFPGTSGKAIVIAGHYDTKRMPLVNFVGANDGGSSTGFLLEMAHVLSRNKLPDDIYLVWFDGEEAVAQWTAADSCYGSRHLSEKWSSDGTLSRVKAFINVDMIGDKNLDIVADTNSSTKLRNLVWKTADELGDKKYFLRDGGGIEDDHLPFVGAGVNSLDIIDFDYGPRNEYWHTGKDTLDKLGAHSFQVVGDVVLKSIASLSGQ